MYEINKNRIEMYGKIKGEPTYDHTIFDERFYKLLVEVERKSGCKDIAIVIVSELFLSLLDLNRFVFVSGQIRAYNKKVGFSKKTEVVVFSKEIRNVEKGEDINDNNKNLVFLEGYLCKAPLRRKTPTGRDVCECIVAVNRANGKADYIPVITWGRNAIASSMLKQGDKIGIRGRFQSREYTKVKEDKSIKKKMTYEVSVNSINLLNKFQGRKTELA